MKRLQSQSIRRQVAYATLALVVPIAAGAGWSAIRARQERAAEIHQEAMSVAAAAAAYFDLYLHGLDSTASALAHDADIMRLSREDRDSMLASVLQRDHTALLNAVLLAPDGTFTGSGRATISDRPGPLLPLVNQIFKTAQPAVSGLTVGPATQKPAIMFAYPVPVQATSGSVAGVLMLGLNLLAIEPVLGAIPLPEGSVVTLTTHQGLILARSRDAEKYLGTTTTIPPPGTAGDPPQLVTDVDGTERITGSADVLRGPWTMSVGIPSSVVVARLWPLWRRNVVIVVVCLMVAMLSAMSIGGQLSRQLKDLRAAASRIATGDLSPISPVPSTNKELFELQSEFQTMADKLRDARQALDQQVRQERRSREEILTLQRQVVRQERLAAVGLLVSGVAHELNNPLQAIMGAAELLERDPGLSAEAIKELALVKTQGHRASEIIRSLSRFSTQHPTEAELVDIGAVVSEVSQLRAGELASAHIAFESDIRSKGLVHASFTELEQVVLNFVINAQQAIQSARPDGGRLIIRSFDVDGGVRLEVLDNGRGVDRTDESKLFQPFFTTKPVGQGTGLGLSVSYGIIDSYGGTIGYQRNEFGGSTFYFELPQVSSS